MSVEGLEGTMLKIPKWEAELWSYVSSGDGVSCPLYDHCQVRKRGDWCFGHDRERLNRLLDGRRFNLDDYDFIESEAKGLCRLGQLLERLAQKYLKVGKVHHPPVPTRLVMLFDQQHTVEVHQVPLKVYHGAIWHHKDGWLVQLKDSDKPATKRFTLFHEGFHILAHCQTAPVFRKRGSVLGSFNELLADGFAVCTLMPREWVKEKWAEVKDLDRMTEIFDVPKPAMCIRLRVLGLV